jgi:hypothetical protein
MPYRWELLLWLWLAFFFHQADRQVFNVILPALGKSLALSSVARPDWLGIHRDERGAGSAGWVPR